MSVFVYRSGWERLAAEREALNSAKMEIENAAEIQKAQWEMDLEKDHNKRQVNVE